MTAPMNVIMPKMTMPTQAVYGIPRSLYHVAERHIFESYSL